MVLLVVIGYGSCMGFARVKMMMGKVIFGGLGTGWKMVLVSFIRVGGGNRGCIEIFRI